MKIKQSIYAVEGMLKLKLCYHLFNKENWHKMLYIFPLDHLINQWIQFFNSQPVILTFWLQSQQFRDLFLHKYMASATESKVPRVHWKLFKVWSYSFRKITIMISDHFFTTKTNPAFQLIDRHSGQTMTFKHKCYISFLIDTSILHKDRQF